MCTRLLSEPSGGRVERIWRAVVTILGAVGGSGVEENSGLIEASDFAVSESPPYSRRRPRIADTWRGVQCTPLEGEGSLASGPADRGVGARCKDLVSDGDEGSGER